MIGKQLLKKMRLELNVTGEGKNMTEATEAIFKQIHQQVYQEVNVPIIQMETEEVYFDDVASETIKNAILPMKETQKVVVKSRIVLIVKYLDIDKENEL